MSHARNSLATSVNLPYWFWFWSLGSGRLQTQRLSPKPSDHESFPWCEQLSVIPQIGFLWPLHVEDPLPTSPPSAVISTSLALLGSLVGSTRWTKWGNQSGYIIIFLRVFLGGSVLSVQTQAELYQPSWASCALCCGSGAECFGGSGERRDGVGFADSGVVMGRVTYGNVHHTEKIG